MNDSSHYPVIRNVQDPKVQGFIAFFPDGKAVVYTPVFPGGEPQHLSEIYLYDDLGFVVSSVAKERLAAGDVWAYQGTVESGDCEEPLDSEGDCA